MKELEYVREYVEEIRARLDRIGANDLAITPAAVVLAKRKDEYIICDAFTLLAELNQIYTIRCVAEDETDRCINLAIENSRLVFRRRQ